MIDRREKKGGKLPHLFVVPKSAPPPDTAAAAFEADELYLRLAPIDQLIGGEIEKRREKLGLSRKYVSGDLGVSMETLENYETGHCQITTETLIAIGLILRCNPVVFFRTASIAIQLDIDVIKSFHNDTTNTNNSALLNNDMLDIIINLERFIAILSYIKCNGETSLVKGVD